MVRQAGALQCGLEVRLDTQSQVEANKEMLPGAVDAIHILLKRVAVDSGQLAESVDNC